MYKFTPNETFWGLNQAPNRGGYRGGTECLWILWKLNIYQKPGGYRGGTCKFLVSDRFWIYRQYITHVAKRGGPCVYDIFGLFFLKNRFLSDYVVAGCPKYIFGNFRNFLKNSEKKFFKIFTLGTFNGPLKIAPNVKKSRFQGAEKAQNRSWPKKSIFSKSEISIPQSNHGKRNIKLMLVRP